MAETSNLLQHYICFANALDSSSVEGCILSASVARKTCLWDRGYLAQLVIQDWSITWAKLLFFQVTLLVFQVTAHISIAENSAFLFAILTEAPESST